jgi:hypothetical protein
MIVAGDGWPEIDSGREFKRGNHEIGNVSDVVIERTTSYTRLPDRSIFIYRKSPKW